MKLNLIQSLLLTTILCANPLYAEHETFPETLPGDPRKVRSESSPDWLAAVGRLLTLLRLNKLEQCTLSIVTDHPAKDGIIGITAGHCVDHWYQRDGTFNVGSNAVTFTANTGITFSRSIASVLVAETSPGDFAIVKLDAPISREMIQPLIYSPFDYSHLLDEERFGKTFKPFATLAGHSSDRSKGQKGEILTYHEKCLISGGNPGNRISNCTSYGGASGGPVVITVDLGALDKDKDLSGTQHLFVGSVKGGKQSSDYAWTVFTETSYYTRQLDKILAAH